LRAIIENAIQTGKLAILCTILISVFITCNSTYTSKKRGYFKVDFPKKKYVQFEQSGFPYMFEYPVYARIVKDSTYFDNDPDNPYWINMDFPTFRGKIFISYKVIGGKSVYKIKTPSGYKDSIGINSFENMVNDSYKLSYRNDIKAYSIDDSVMHTPNNLTGIFFSLTGNVATSKQFFLSDSTRNFLRGALYFDATPDEDSLKPVNDFLQQDMYHLINTLKWTNANK
jgi:gliding motility-associated lipoprotein GldD